MLKMLKGGGSPNHMVTCPKCRCSVFIEVRHSVMRNGNNTTAGQKAKACAKCLVAGDLVMI